MAVHAMQRLQSAVPPRAPKCFFYQILIIFSIQKGTVSMGEKEDASADQG